MAIARLNGLNQVTCDSCPASYPNTYAAEGWQVMIADAKAAGWVIRKAGPQRDQRDTSDLFGTAPRIAGAKRDEPYTHTCPDCANPLPAGGLL